MRVLMEYQSQWQTMCSAFQLDLFVSALEANLLPENIDGTAGEIANRLAVEDVPFSCPMLEEVRFACHRASTPDAFHLVRSYMFSEQLKRVTLQGLQMDPMALHLHWGELTHLSLLSNPRWGMIQSGALMLLSMCPKLEAISLPVMATVPPAESDPDVNVEREHRLRVQKVTMHHLRALEVITTANENVNFLFTNLHLPALRHLAYKASPRQAHTATLTTPTASLPPTILLDSPSTPPLESLSVNIAQSMHPQLIEYLDSCVTLPKLQITGVGIDPSHFRRLGPVCRKARVQEVDMDIFVMPRPAPATVLSSATMHVETNNITGFVNQLLEPYTDGDAMDPQPSVTKRFMFRMKSAIPSLQEEALEAFGQDIREQTNGKVKVEFGFQPRRAFKKSSPWDGANLMEREERSWFQ